MLPSKLYHTFLLEVYKEPFLTEPIYIIKTIRRSSTIIPNKFKPLSILNYFLTINAYNQISLSNEGLYYVENYLLDKPIETYMDIDSDFIYLLKMLIGIKNKFGITEFRVIPDYL